MSVPPPYVGSRDPPPSGRDADDGPRAGRLSNRLIALWALLGLLATGALAAVVLAGGTPAYAANVVQIALVLPLVVVSTWRGRRRVAGGSWSVAPWRLMGAGWWMYLAGLVVWNATYVAGRAPTSPAVWDVLYLAALPLFTAGLLVLPRHPRGAPRFPRLLLDGLLLSFGLIAASWSLWVGDQLSTPTWSAGYVVGVGYNVLNFVLLGTALIVLSRLRPGVVGAVLWLTVGFATLSATDLLATASGFGALTVDEGWLYVGFTLLGVPLNVGVLLAVREVGGLRTDATDSGSRALLAPVVGAVGILVAIVAPGSTGVPTSLLVAAVIVGVVRELVAFQERRADRRLQPLVVSEAQDRVRRRLAEDLHDEVLQDLVTLRWTLEDLAEHRPSPELDDAGETLSRCVSDLRRVVAGTHPSLAGSDLEGVLREVAERLDRPGGPRIGITVAPGAASDRAPLMAVIARELVRNAVEHAAATRIDVRIEEAPGPRGPVLRLSVVDDGRGIPAGRPAAARRDGHLGLASCIERTRAAGGSLTLSAGTDGAGTAICVLLPATEPLLAEVGVRRTSPLLAGPRRGRR